MGLGVRVNGGDRIKLLDVAKLAGVSQATASNILNHRKIPSFVTERTQKKVRSAASQLGYRPNHLARMLRAKQSQTLGFVLPDLSSPLACGLTSEIFKLSIQHGYRVFLDLASANKTTEAIDNLISRAVDGIFIYWPSEGLKFPENLPLPPLVAIDTSIAAFNDIPVDCVEIDRSSGIFDATSELLSEGRRHVALAVPKPLTRTAREKINGWRSAYAKAGIQLPTDERIVSSGSPSESGLSLTEGRKLADAVLEYVPDVDALLCPYWAVQGVLTRLAEIGRRVPEDISLVALNTVITSSQQTNGLPTVAFPIKKIAEDGVNMLLEHVQDAQSRARATRVVKVSMEWLPTNGSREEKGGCEDN